MAARFGSQSRNAGFKADPGRVCADMSACAQKEEKGEREQSARAKQRSVAEPKEEKGERGGSAG